MPESARGPGSSTAPSRRRWAPLFLGLFALAGVVAVVVHVGEAERFLALARESSPAWLLVAFALQCATYATEAGVWSGVLARSGHPRPFRELYALALVALFTNQLVPSAGVAGTVLIVRALTQRGVPERAAVAAMVVDLVGYYLAFGCSLAFALAVLWARHELPIVVLWMAGVMVLVGIGVAGGALMLAAPGRVLPKPLARIAPLRRAAEALAGADPALLTASAVGRAAILRAGNFAADALTLWSCLRAVGQATPPMEAAAAFVIGTVARTLGVVPGGLGTFEGGTVGGLALFSVPVEAALAATLLFRGLSFWLPMVPGVLLGRREARGFGR